MKVGKHEFSLSGFSALCALIYLGWGWFALTLIRTLSLGHLPKGQDSVALVLDGMILILSSIMLYAWWNQPVEHGQKEVIDWRRMKLIPLRRPGSPD